MGMREVLRSSVNEWECDQMGHLNVRHYLGRANDGVALLLAELGLGPARLRKDGAVLRAVDQHVRFVRELRPGSAYVVRAGVVAAASDVLRSYQELSIQPSDDLSASMRTETALIDRESGARRDLSALLTTRSLPMLAQIPPHGEARGIVRDAPQPPPTREQAIARGLCGAFLGPVQPEDCDAHGLMRESGMMARVSDGMAHFFISLRDSPRPQGLGGAALEYRFVFRAWPRLGDFLEVRSGLKSVGKKTSNISHYIFDVESGACVATAEAVSVTFDLTTRKSVEIPDDVRAMMQQHVIAGLGV